MSAPQCRGRRQARDRLAKWLALGVSLVALVVAIVMAVAFNTVGGPTSSSPRTISWIQAFGVHYAVGVDGIALVLILLTAVLVPVVHPGVVDAATR